MTKPLFRLAHLSDLHFSKITWNPAQFLSKQWIGNLNWISSRQREFTQRPLELLPPLLKELQVDAVLITGDLSCTSRETEFEMAKLFLDSLKEQGMRIFTLPGNHDQYTQRAYSTQRFYNFFDATYAPDDSPHPLSLKEDKLTSTYLGHQWWLFSLDTALATPLFKSSGYFSEELEVKLEKALRDIPSEDRVILMNHFPLFSNETPRKELVRKEALQELLKRFPSVTFYLHGHSHRHAIADLRNSHLPIVLDSGATAKKRGGTWNLIDLNPNGCTIEAFRSRLTQEVPTWETFSKIHFGW